MTTASRRPRATPWLAAILTLGLVGALLAVGLRPDLLGASPPLPFLIAGAAVATLAGLALAWRSAQVEATREQEREAHDQALLARDREVTEARQHQAATAEIVAVLSRAPADSQPVFDAIVQSAVRLCDALFGTVILARDGLLHLAALHGFVGEERARMERRFPVSRDAALPSAEVIREGRPVHLPDATMAPSTDWVEGFSFRSYVSVPMLLDGRAIGAVAVARREAGPFSDRQLGLLQTFANQAVIAVENTRLFQAAEARNRDLTEALERERATSGILRAIATSPTDPAPVFEAILESALRLCRASIGGVLLSDGEVVSVAAVRGHPGTVAATRAAFPRRLTDEGLVVRAVREGVTVHVADLREEPSNISAIDEAEGIRSQLSVPMIREGRCIGVISVLRPELGLFSAPQVALVHTLADQAAIAVENVRLFEELQARNRELTESLERETATSGILRAIATSPTDPAPVFEAILESALRLCRASIGAVFLSDGETVRVAAVKGPPGSIEAARAVYPRPLSASGLNVRAIREGVTLHVGDVRQEPSSNRVIDEAYGIRGELAVPMIREGRCIGGISVARSEPGLFSEPQVALLHTLADQAAIAVENVRLFEELQARNRDLTQSLEQQTATAEILRVISSSPTDVAPVFQAIASNAGRLLGGLATAVTRFDGELVHVGALDHFTAEAAAMLRGMYPRPPSDRSLTDRAVIERSVVHVADLARDPAIAESTRTLNRLLGHTSFVAVPMLREGNAVGAISVGGHAPFSDQQIALLRTFADQAAIAVENVRLFQELQARNRELTQSLERETATSDILRIISRSPTALQPVLDAIVTTATRLCAATNGAVFRFDGEVFQLAATYHVSPEFQAYLHANPVRPGLGTPLRRAGLERRPVFAADVLGDPDLGAARAAYEREGLRTALAVPMLKEDALIGAITIHRRELGSFTDAQIKLVTTFADQAVIAIENVRLFEELQARNRDLTEALEQQTATSEVLKAISQATYDLQPVLATLIENSTRLCAAEQGFLFRFDGEFLRVAATFGASPAFRDYWVEHPIRPEPGSNTGRAAFERRTLHIVDTLAEADYKHGESQKLQPFRSVLCVPMLKDEALVGVLTMLKPKVEPFSDRQIELVQTFADQAVIAIENVRLFQELQARNRDLTESLEQQTATAEILRVISGSPTDVQPVFDAIVRSAVRLCDGLYGTAHRFDGQLVHLTAHHNCTPEVLRALQAAFPRQPDRQMLSGRAILTRAVVHVEDVLADPEYPQDVGRAGGFRAVLAVPMLREGDPIGSINVIRGRPGPFSSAEIKLLGTFADQAVIAIENVRLFQELQARNRDLTESLEQQTATGEILQVISSSPTDIEPVFDAMIRSAVRLCEGTFGAIYRYDGERVELAGAHNIPEPVLTRYRQTFPQAPHRGLLAMRAILDRAVIQVSDLEQDAEYANREFTHDVGIRSHVAVPLLREGAAVGAIAVGRAEPGPFRPRLVELLQTFAAQAVIAIENVRLFTELGARNRDLTEALERQTATSEVLKVISRSTFDLEPVLTTLIENTSRLCGADSGVIYRMDGGTLRVAADYRVTAEFRAYWQPEGMRPGRQSAVGRALLEGRTIQIADVLADPEYELHDAQRMGGFRTLVAVPMFKAGDLLGVILVWRTEARPFTDSQIELVTTFADQAVIAIENVRLLQELQTRNRETMEALAQQTATAQVLQVISSSPTDAQPVFDMIAERAARLCEADDAVVRRLDGEVLELVAVHGASLGRSRWPVQRGIPTGQAILERTAVHVHDLTRYLDVAEVRGESPDPGLATAWAAWLGSLEREGPSIGSAEAQALVLALRSTVGVNDDLREFYIRVIEGGVRTILAVPLLREGMAIGTIAVRRKVMRPFTEKQVALVKTFADQAVIAIENVRLFTELQARNRDLLEALEQQTATGQVLQVISRSPTDVQPVFDTILDSAVRLCAGQSGAVYRAEAGQVHLVSIVNPDAVAREAIRAAYPRAVGEMEPTPRRVVTDGKIMHLADIETAPGLSDAYRERGRIGGYRSSVGVPMLREGQVIGAINVVRAGPERTPKPFSDREIALLQVFADQAVIAIENVRLVTELQARNRETTEALEQQTATAEVLQVISSTLTDPQPVFDMIIERAVRLCQGTFGVVYLADAGQIRDVAHYNVRAEAFAALRATFPRPLDRSIPSGEAIFDRRVVHIADVEGMFGEDIQRVVRLIGARGQVTVPMLRGAEAIGTLVVARDEPGEFPEKQVALLKTFADQAVIAIENVRLFRELRQRTDELTRSVEELRALGEVGRAVGSTLDLETVLSTIVSRANQLAGTDGGAIYEYDDQGQVFRLRAAQGFDEALIEALRAMRPRLGEGAVGRAGAERAPVQIPDILVAGAYEGRLRPILERAGFRSLLAVPLLREDTLVGALAVSRHDAGTFSDASVNLLQTFATQSVLAIQNARLYRELEEKGRELEVASRHKGQFLANMSHELRTPLNAILGYTELILDRIYGEVPERIREVLDRIDRSGRHLLGLINDVLDLSKIEAGQLTLALADYSLREVVHAVVTQVESLAAEKGLALRAEVAPDLPPGRGDERRLTQVLLNLVGNAIKFTERGEVGIDARLRDGSFEVTVRDTGPGIAPDDQAKIFEEFQQADSSSTRKKGGTGLGLSIARRIVELHGGRLTVESSLGAGATFTFTVPVRVERQVGAA